MNLTDNSHLSSPQNNKSEIISKTTKVVVVTTVMFTFISFWRAAAIVVGDLGSTAYYIGGIVEQFVGKVAPYFIFLLMLFSFAVTSLYMESSPMFTRGGVYRVVKFSLGHTFAKVSVSALIFDYILTGPISSVSAGHYITGLMNDIFSYTGLNLTLSKSIFPVIFAIAIIVFFWRENVKGIEESSSKALKIFIITAIMGIIILLWGLITLLVDEKSIIQKLPPLNINLSDEAYGWLKDIDWIKSISIISIMIAFGHSMLALSGIETLGQVYREVKYPKVRNFKKTVFAIFTFSVILTPGVSFLGIMLIPDEIRPQYIDNLIGGITMYLYAPHWINLILQAFVVIVGALILSGAVNTAIIGANSVLNRVAEDKVLTDWFRKPSKKFGTTYRILNLIAIMQILTIILSRGDILLLGEAYAFGVIWSLTFKAFSMIVLRYKDKREREWKVPLNIFIRSFELPVGLILIFFVLFFTAITNLFTKPVATVSGVIFTISFFIIFTVSEIIVRKTTVKEKKITEEQYEKDRRTKRILEHFNLEYESDITPEAIGSENKDRILIAVKDPGNLNHMQKILKETDTTKTDIIVMIARVIKDKTNMTVEEQLESDEMHLFSEVVNTAERIGKPVIPLVIPTNNAFFSIVNVAAALNVREIVLGLSMKYKPDIQQQQLAILWGTVQSDETKKVISRIITQNKEYIQEL